MLTITRSQLQAFAQEATRRFEDKMVLHLRQFAPKHSEVLREPELRQIIRFGIKASQNYGLTNHDPVRLYIELMFMFGSEFDTDPQFPWAQRVLHNPLIPNQALRADRLYDEAVTYVDHVAGPDRGHSLAALKRLSRVRGDDLPSLNDSFEDAIFDRLREIHPQKCDYIGETASRELIRRSVESAKSRMASTSVGAALFVGLTFTVGHGFASDPLFPWIKAVLNDPTITSASDRANRLLMRTMIYLNKALTYLE